MSKDKTPVPVDFTIDELDRFCGGVADVLCWVKGFEAAKGDGYQIIGADDLRDLNIRLKEAWRRATDSRKTLETGK